LDDSAPSAGGATRPSFGCSTAPPWP
jgi:hypothetical protein